MKEIFEGGVTPHEQEKTPEEIIKEFKDDFEKYLKENPNVASKLKKEILSMAGVEENELVDEDMGFDFGVVKIPVEKLTLFGTSCGVVGNKAFTEKIVDFLKSLNVRFIIGLSRNREFKISSAAIPITKKNGREFEEMIYNQRENQGVLRCDSSRVRGWTKYESE